MRTFLKIIFVLTYRSLWGLTAYEDIFRDVVLRFYHGNSSTTYTEFKLNEATRLLGHPSFDLNDMTIIYIHGWNEKMNEAETLLVLVESYLSRKNHNVMVLNFETLAKKFYTTVVENSKELGKRVADALRRLFYRGLSPNRIHLLGFSVGAHICAEIGRFDPSYPMYYGTGEYLELNRNDAKFVDIIHTDGGIIGGPTSSGHADFYPNNGRRPQPRCGNAFWQFLSIAFGDHCAHDSSVHYYAQSVTAINPIFIATNKYIPYDITEMGYNCLNTALGDYYLKTD
ncbi:Endothelial lipase [Pseudolycoriella hygida]|uniref:Endothelial lipase n=1 Tax=Pseudolycoriella hygida TaxID=35572 RepID=A0A9Q0RXB9_9DIPT|nr:Endothelial lipase [Pseudolycoriella hygida]